MHSCPDWSNTYHNQGEGFLCILILITTTAQERGQFGDYPASLVTRSLAVTGNIVGIIGEGSENYRHGFENSRIAQ